jgi:hypothetical protein
MYSTIPIMNIIIAIPMIIVVLFANANLSLSAYCLVASSDMVFRFDSAAISETEFACATSFLSSSITCGGLADM